MNGIIFVQCSIATVLLFKFSVDNRSLNNINTLFAHTGWRALTLTGSSLEDITVPTCRYRQSAEFNYWRVGSLGPLLCTLGDIPGCAEKIDKALVRVNKP
nr:MAG: hypothetical protein H2BulkLitter11510_000002 [Mitovirus sp.]